MNEGKSSAVRYPRRQKWILVAFSGVIFAAILALLISGSPLLLKPTPGIAALPWGNLLVWVALLVWVVFLWALFLPLKPNSGPYLKRLAQVRNWSGLMAVLWFPVTALLAGNLRLSFSRESAFGDPDLASGLSVFLTMLVLLAPLVGCMLMVWTRGKDKSV